MLYIRLIAILLGFMACHNPYVNAKSNYSTEHEVEYYLGIDRTYITHKLKININDKYKGIESLTFIEPTEDILNLKLEKNNLGAEIVEENGKIFINFRNLLVGPKTETIQFNYSSDTIFRKIGKTYVLDIPKVKESESIDSFNLKVYFPKSTGQLQSFINNLKNDDKGAYLVFNKEELMGFGETIIFGNEEYYVMKVTNIVSPDKNYIVLPTTITDRQEVYVQNISKPPYRVSIDMDKNTILYYKVSSPEKITTDYTVKVYGNKSKAVNNFYYTDTKAIKNWDYTEGYPKYVLSNLKGSEKYGQLQDIFSITKETLSYSSEKSNYDYINRIGAENLNNKNFSQSVCLEYTDLLIALLRGVKIPAREINGYALNTSNTEKPLPHSWVEYLDKNGYWVQVDPTWADTSNQNYFDTFDLYHIGFLTKGVNSESPKLAGSHKIGVLEEAVELSILTEIPRTEQVAVKKVGLGPLLIVKNDSYNTISFTNKLLKPKSWGFYFNEELKTSNTLFDVKWEKLNFKDFLGDSLFYFVPLIISPLVFYIIHKKLKKLSKNKNKIKSII